MPFAASISSDPAADEVLSKSRERRALSVACGAHALHGGYTDLIWVALPIWQAESASLGRSRIGPAIEIAALPSWGDAET